MTGRLNPGLDSLRDERDHVMILLNLMENSDAPDVTALDQLRDRLSDLEQRVRMSQANRGQSGGDPQDAAPTA